MPLPNYGHFNKEEKKTQQLVFQSPPEIVEEDGDVITNSSVSGVGGGGRSRRARVTTGKMDIEMERKLVFKTPGEKDREAWKAPPTLSSDERREIQKYSSENHKQMKSQVKSTLYSFISGQKAANQIKPSSGRDSKATSIQV